MGKPKDETPRASLAMVPLEQVRPSGRPVPAAPVGTTYRPLVVRPVGGRFDGGRWCDVERFDLASGEREYAGARAAGLESVVCQIVPMTDAELSAARAAEADVFTIDPAAAAALKVHKVADLFPGMGGEEYEAFKEDIRANGQSDPAWLHKGELIDGRHRRRASIDLGLPLKVREWDGEGSLVGFVVGLNLHRRHLSSGQRATLAAELEPLLAEEAKGRQRAAGGDKKSEAARAEAIKNTLPASLPDAQRDKLAAEIAKSNAAERDRRTKAKSVPQKVAEPIRRENEAREQAAKITGTNRQYVSDAKAVKEKAPELFQKVKAGEMTLPQAKVEVRRQEKREELKEKAKAAEKVASDTGGPAAPPPWEIVRGEVGHSDHKRCRLSTVPAGVVRLVFADPPYNIGFDYGEGHDDRRTDADYLMWVGHWVRACSRALAADGTMWVLINDEYAADYRRLLGSAGLTVRNWVIWYESFGVNCADKFNRTKRHLFYAVKDPKRFTFHPDAVTRPSDRQAKYNDARAAPGGKILDDVWFDVPRLVGTAAERIPDFPTQLPLSLLRRIVACSSNPGDLVLDPFSGSGTTGVAALELGRRYLGIERSKKFAEVSRLRLKGVSRDAG